MAWSKSSKKLALEDEWRTLTFSHLPKSLYDLAQVALNRARYLACEADPSDAKLLEAMVASLMLEPVWSSLPKDVLAKVDAGQARCKRCSSWDVSQLTSHHIQPRSHGGHEGPQVPLCLACHDIVQKDWRHYARLWGYDEEADVP